MVLSNKMSRPSARVLNDKLEENSYAGLPINYGCSVIQRDYGNMINKPEAVARAVNKRIALQLLMDAGIKTPLISHTEALELITEGKRVVGRPDNHSKGRRFYIASTANGVDRAVRHGATHFLEYIDNALEFRVHIVNGCSIKLSQKIAQNETDRLNHRFGTVFEYPHDFTHKKTLRRIAKESIEALGLDFGAVDLLYRGDEFYVLEVNTAPCLTDPYSDTLDRYARAFLSAYNQ
jgi:glutathione synthase/RimK-type ligase-like ATP-grasp enzyme